MRRDKFKLILFLGVAVAAIVLLAAGLAQLELLPGQLVSFGEPRPSAGPQEGERTEGPDFWAISIVVAVVIIWITLPVLIIYFLFVRKERKYFWGFLLALVWALLFYYVRFVAMRELMSQTPESVRPETTPVAEEPLPTVDFIAEAPEWLIVVVSVGLALLIVGLAWLFWFWRRRRRLAGPLEMLAQEAQDALGELQAGVDLKHVILRCYVEMCQILSKRRGLKRQKAMTTREFARRLEEEGLPREQVQRLTRLFEVVRYGDKLASEQEEGEAVECLTAIVQACGGAP